METWATTVETLFTVNRYRNLYGNPNYSYLDNNFQNTNILDDIHYTSAGIDMIEGNYGFPPFNQGAGNDLEPDDRVDNFTIEQLEQALSGARSWNQWRDNLFSQNDGNNTRDNLNELFENW